MIESDWQIQTLTEEQQVVLKRLVRELNISEVAALCGYNDTPNFTRAFKKAFGITPTQYQARQAKFKG